MAWRVQVLRALTEGALSVHDLALIVGDSRTRTQQHLRILRDARLITRSGRVRRRVYYDLASSAVARAVSTMLESIPLP